ncbi:MAG: hypothetical protein PHO91_00935 [Patescibacteria group bacterium]|nr:hypothetical protein [Patescibacteria group bacterium]
MMKKIILSLAFFSLIVSLPVLAANVSDHEEAQSLIEQKTECSQLSDGQLEKIGDYYIELMAPDQGHEAMDQMMGGEGSESLRQAHILMARRWYCGDAIGMGMMGMMTGNYGPRMMNWGSNQNNQFGLYGNGMMGSGWGSNMMYGFSYRGGWMIAIYVLVVIFLLVGIATFVKYLLGKK